MALLFASQWAEQNKLMEILVKRAIWHAEIQPHCCLSFILDSNFNTDLEMLKFLSQKLLRLALQTVCLWSKSHRFCAFKTWSLANAAVQDWTQFCLDLSSCCRGYVVCIYFFVHSDLLISQVCE